MADIADKAAEHIERESAGLLAQRRPIGPVANGFCHWCEATVAAALRWCDADCRNDYERDQRRNRVSEDE